MSIEDIAFEAEYPHPPEVVWRAIATREGLAAWLMDNDFGAASVGHEFQFRDRPRAFWNGISDRKVLEADEPRKLTLLWNHKEDKHPSTVTWTLARTPSGGTKLSFRHSSFHGFMGMIMKKGMEHGWGKKMNYSIPLVADAIAQQRPLPTRASVKAHEKQMLKAAA